ncbi:hypothetical protein D9611_011481 [Ephemerocybe angulata]|uniref:Nephrocystin 3-like N-terminal domain-containing protein n=1 Tax=Ephemerocybe angulata TaxID=980116 RepID=A0A8H5CDL3_9AGAR|nr:hypothetical protein D9611_011481 [Tulosesus angulatus]
MPQAQRDIEVTLRESIGIAMASGSSETSHGPHFFQNAQSFSIGRQSNISQQTDYFIHNHAPGHMGLLDMLDPIPDASYSRNRQTSPPDSDCLPGTRRDMLKRVSAWADASVLLPNPHVMWLYGYVGCGKSAIAQTVAEKYARKGRLAGSFFFFRTSRDRSRTARFVATLASQIAASIPSTAPLIETALKRHVGLLHSTTSLSSQLEHLVYGPIKSVRWESLGRNLLRGPYIIVIDGLDECEDRDDIALFIDHMLDFFSRNPHIPLRFFIASRVEEHIRTRLNDREVRLVNLVDHTSVDDIATAMHASFALAARHNRIIQAYGPWPSPADLSQLVHHTGCSFAFMSTLLKFILGPSPDNLTPMQRLPLALDINLGLDGLYLDTLSRAGQLPHFSSIITLIALAENPFSIAELGKLLRIERTEVVRVLIELHAILQVPGDDYGPVTMFHTSLHDFLTHPGRSGPFYIDPSQSQDLARRCKKVLSARSSNLSHDSAAPASPLEEGGLNHLIWRIHV